MSTEKLPTYFTPNGGKSISIRYAMFAPVSEQEEKQDILNYRTRRFAEAYNVEWYSETGLGEGDVGAIYIFHKDTDIVIKCAVEIVNYLKKYSNIKFIPDPN